MCVPSTDTTVNDPITGFLFLIEEVSGMKSDNTTFAQADLDSVMITITENQELIGNKVNATDLSYQEGAYEAWSDEEYKTRCTISIYYALSSSSSISPSEIKAPSEKSKDLGPVGIQTPQAIDGLGASFPIPTSTEPHNYVAASLLNAVETWWWMNKGMKLTLSYTQFNDALKSEGVQDNVKAAEEYLVSSGVCESYDFKTNGDAECLRYRVDGFIQPEAGQRTTQTLLDWVVGGHPVFVLMALNPPAVQHHSDIAPEPIHEELAREEKSLNFGGVVTGYDLTKSGNEYWHVAMPRHGYRNTMLKVRLDMSGRDFGRMTKQMTYVDRVNMDPIPEVAVTVSTVAELNALNASLTHLTISNVSLNDITALDLNRFPRLMSIVVGDQSCGNVARFVIDGLNRLESVKIGSRSFRLDNSENKDREFHLTNCLSLVSLEIGRNSFTDYYVLELKRLPSLQSIKMGNSEDSYCFYFTPDVDFIGD